MIRTDGLPGTALMTEVAITEKDVLDTARQAARVGGDVLRDWAGRFTVSEKAPSDLVTEADVESQKAISEVIRTRHPGHGLLGEEGLDETGRDSEWCWVIDPLDGTSNYVHGFPYYAVSVAVTCSGRPVAGAIYDPNRDEMFSGARACGATLNGSAIRPGTAQRLDEAMVIASLPVNAGPDDPAVGRFLAALPHVQTVQRTGSAALNLACVACGRIDAFWSTSLKPWDVAAGVLIVQEAGGSATTLTGGPVDIYVPDLLVSNGKSIHQGLQAILASGPPDQGFH